VGATAIVIGAFIGLPLVLVAGLAVIKPRSRIAWMSVVVMVAAVLFFLSKAGAGWHVLSVDLPWVWWFGFLAASLFSSWRMGGAPLLPPQKLAWAGIAATWLATAFTGVALVEVLEGTQPKDAEPVELVFPLGPGEIYVTHGGASAALNHHYGVKAQRYALDLVALDDLGRRADGMFPTTTAAYEIYGAPVRSPCDGRVTLATDGLDDQDPPQADKEHLAGNHVVVFCKREGVSVLLAHLEKNSILVKPGKRVKAGQELGAVGNTGNTSEPHLHVHAVRGEVSSTKELLTEAEPVPMTFGGRFLVRNDKVVVR
jgi:hypothetical protein